MIILENQKTFKNNNNLELMNKTICSKILIF